MQLLVVGPSAHHQWAGENRQPIVGDAASPSDGIVPSSRPPAIIDA
jgi:hypothetical protein